MRSRSKVDVHNPEVMVCIEIRSLINIYSKEIQDRVECR